MTATPTPGTYNADGSINTSEIAGSGLNLGQGSATAGQGGPLVQGAVTTSAPTYVNGQTSPLNMTTNGILRVGIFTAAGAALGTSIGASDGQTDGTALYVAAKNLLFNGSNLDRARGNFDAGALLSLLGAGAGTQTSPDQVNYNGRGAKVVIDVTAATTMTIIVKVQGKDAASGKYYDILTSAALATTGTTVLTVYPDATVAANLAVSDVVPRVWRVSATITGTSVTATVGASVIL